MDIMPCFVVLNDSLVRIVLIFSGIYSWDALIYTPFTPCGTCGTSVHLTQLISTSSTTGLQKSFQIFIIASAVNV